MAETPPPPPPPIAVLNTWAIYSDAPNAFYKSFADEALSRLEERKAEVDRLSTRQDWERYREEVRRKLGALAGPFPGKTPLNAHVAGVVRKPGFRVEKIIYESLPDFHVTAALFVPEGLQGKAPAIIYCSGHSGSGFRSRPYQTMILNLVKKGFIVLAFDPIGQGERLQYVNPETGRPVYGAQPVREHTQAGTQAFLIGSSLAHYMIWDGIRSVDYLMTRPEVDSARIGITGRSGGGTQSAYIAAFDERIAAAAPENYLTTFEQLLKTRGPQDPEQNFYAGIAQGFDQADLLIARAPKPALIVATTRDIFNIEGTRTVYAEARRAYAALGRAGDVAMTVDDAGHSSTRKNREATYAFFREHLNLPGDTADENVELLSADELRVTETGQVATSLAGETIPSLIRRAGETLERQLELRRRDLATHLAAVKADAGRLAGYTPRDNRGQTVVFSGRFARNGYSLEEYLLPVDDRYAIPILALVPDAPSTKVVVYLHPGGKSVQAGEGGELESLARKGVTVIAPDVVGIGELGPGIMGAAGAAPPRLWYGYVLLGKSMLGRQLQDLDRVLHFATARFGAPRGALLAVARGALGPLLLHANALTGAFNGLVLIDAPLSYRGMVATPAYAPTLVHGAVPAALTAYDLPDLAACVAPGRLLLVDPRDGSGAPADDKNFERDVEVIGRAYARAKSQSQLRISRIEDDTAVSDAFDDLLR